MIPRCTLFSISRQDNLPRMTDIEEIRNKNIKRLEAARKERELEALRVQEEMSAREIEHAERIQQLQLMREQSWKLRNAKKKAYLEEQKKRVAADNERLHARTELMSLPQFETRRPSPNRQRPPLTDPISTSTPTLASASAGKEQSVTTEATFTTTLLHMPVPLMDEAVDDEVIQESDMAVSLPLMSISATSPVVSAMQNDAFSDGNGAMLNPTDALVAIEVPNPTNVAEDPNRTQSLAQTSDGESFIAASPVASLSTRKNLFPSRDESANNQVENPKKAAPSELSSATLSQAQQSDSKKKKSTHMGVIVTTALEFTLATFAPTADSAANSSKDALSSSEPTLGALSWFRTLVPRVMDHNVALVLIKPEANNDVLKNFVRAKLTHTGFTVLQENTLTGPEIARRKIIDRHYAAMASFATKRSASGIRLSEDKKAAFCMKYKVRWDEALESGRVVNATRAQEVLGGISGAELERLWTQAVKENHQNQMRVARNIVVCHLPQHNLWVVNGFYAALKERFCAEDARTTFMVVSWSEDICSWKHFRENVLGETDPAAAFDGSLRHRIRDMWKKLKLASEPTFQHNCLHGSAGPLEALQERFIWCEAESHRNDIMGRRFRKFLEADPHGQRLLHHGVSPDLLEAWVENPIVRLERFNGNLFDLVQEMNSTTFLQFCQKMGNA
eukprot:PhM_4_TR3036/c0_g1_i3/m.93687